MSFLNAYSAYNALNADQKKFLREKKIDATYPPDGWIAFLSGVARYDRVGDSLRTTFGWIGTVALIIMFISFVTGHIGLAFILFIIGGAAVTIFLLLNRIDLPDSLQVFLLPTISLLREDIQPDGLLHLRVDLKGGTDGGKKGETQNLPNSRGRSIVQTMYNDPWMAGDTTLADGSALQWEITDTIRERTISHRSASGKTKTKKKYRVRRLIDVRIGLRRDDYAIGGAGAAGNDMQVNVKPGAKRNVIRMRRVVQTSDPNATLGVHEFLDPIAGAYRQATLAPTEGKS